MECQAQHVCIYGCILGVVVCLLFDFHECLLGALGGGGSAEPYWSRMAHVGGADVGCRWVHVPA